jgi:hypothetical protein
VPTNKYPREVQTLCLQRDSDWIDRDGKLWHYDEHYGWQYYDDGAWYGSFLVAEDSGPFRAVPSAYGLIQS